METAVHDKHHIDTRRLSKETLLSKRIRFKQTTLQGPDAQLVLEIRTVQGGEVKVRRSVRNARINTVGSEAIYKCQ